jgi:hypothetical protein
MGLGWRIRRVLRLERRDVSLAVLLACLSWFVLTPIWIHSSPGGLVDRAIEGLFYLPYRAGKHLAHVVFPDGATRNTTRYYAAPLMGAMGEVFLLMALWFIGIRVVRWQRAEKHTDAQIDQLKR